MAQCDSRHAERVAHAHSSDENTSNAPYNDSENYFFEKGSIEDFSLVTALLEKYQPRAVINFAAESHVDRSISDSDDFIQTNISGTHALLKASLKYFETLNTNRMSYNMQNQLQKILSPFYEYMVILEKQN